MVVDKLARFHYDFFKLQLINLISFKFINFFDYLTEVLLKDF